MNALSIRFRVARITPTKLGQFVTLWERIGNGPIQPYDVSDPVDFFVISARKGSAFGQFVFPKAVLCDQDIVSNKGKGGKRAIRVYPPWDNPTSRQAQKTQKWQLEYFLEIPVDTPIDYVRVQKLYGPNR
ncbi:MepB family protein [Paenibacillus sp. N3.4]|uniref:MepB family protein n=1 Tax=Paenibacillus sp. N3.4 TaxID=2603222 RepID=UPI0021C2809D|nr:MepB family protein [Paenibacillus sp. N3.4]